MGLGDAAAKLKTLQSALQLGMPILYGRLYNWNKSSPWLMAALLGAIYNAFRLFCDCSFDCFATDIGMCSKLNDGGGAVSGMQRGDLLLKDDGSSWTMDFGLNI